MPDILIVGKDSAYGLTKDGTLLVEALRAVAPHLSTAQAGHRDRSLWEWVTHRRRAHTIVHIERVYTHWLGAAERHFLIPNQERFPRRHLGRLRRITGVLAKSAHAETIFRHHGAEVRRLGFVSEDRRDPLAERDWNAVLHLAGASTLKGTEDILALWAVHPEWPKLVLVQKEHLAPASVPGNVELVSRYLEDGEVKRLQNRCGIHLCPSRAEGWGHHLVEAMSTGALVVTTDAPPMNEHLNRDSGVLVPAARSQARHVGTSFFVDRAALETGIATALALPEARKKALGEQARQSFETSRHDFHRRLAEIFTPDLGSGACGESLAS